LVINDEKTSSSSSSKKKQQGSDGDSSHKNHIYLNLIAPDTSLPPSFFENELRKLMNQYSDILRRFKVEEVEIHLTCQPPTNLETTSNDDLTSNKEPIHVRLIASNPTGYALKVESYLEVFKKNSSSSDSSSFGGGERIFQTVNLRSGITNNNNNTSTKIKPGLWDGLPVTEPYPISHPFDEKRELALKMSDSLYCFDYLELFERGVEIKWEDFIRERGVFAPIPDNVFQATELVVRPRHYSSNHQHPQVQLISQSSSSSSVQGEAGDLYDEMEWDGEDDLADLYLDETSRPSGYNSIGMVVWLVTCKTPEAPSGRQFILIANDITFKAGSFGTKEDVVFFKASEFARKRGIPRLYLAANAGARIGLANSIKQMVKIAWTNEEEPTLGFDYLYLTPQDYSKIHQLNQRSPSSSNLLEGDGEEDEDELVGEVVKGEMITDERTGQERFKITDIVGVEKDLGVENLSGSGLIAGETSAAYNEIFTLSIVVGRTVGIGAYLVRLGQRVIQKTSSSPIILTGYQALNTLLGREIYTTNDQLGGGEIMFPNGVSHLMADQHMEAIISSLDWLSYVPPSTLPSNLSSLPLPSISNNIPHPHSGFGEGEGNFENHRIEENSDDGDESQEQQAVSPYPAVLDITGIDIIERPVDYIPTNPSINDPRHLITGCLDELSGEWKSGLFDKNSFMELMSGWAKTVVVGRARLGGIPVGVIVTEGRVCEKIIPADPGDATSREAIIPQAGGVWFPDSAYKTATVYIFCSFFLFHLVQNHSMCAFF